MTFTINPKCPKCGNKFVIKLNIVDKLQKEIEDLKKELKEAKSLNALTGIFGGFK